MSVLQVKTNPTAEDCGVFSEKSMKDMCFVVIKSHTAVPLGQPALDKTKNPLSSKKTK